MSIASEIQIINTDLNDIDITFKFFDGAIAYQQKNGYELWPQFERKLIETEIAEKRHWKIKDGNMIVGVFSVMYNDPIIWGERDKDPAVYLHRIAANPVCKGKGLMRIIKDWTSEHAKQHNKRYVRMDTWGNNEILRKYYIRCGFNYIGQQYLKDTEGLPGHYGGSHLSLFQNEV